MEVRKPKTIVQQQQVSERQVRQLFGMLIVVNLSLALAQLAIAPLAAAYYRQPTVAHLLRVQALSLYIEGAGTFEFERTASRLREMQAADWGADLDPDLP